MSRFLDFSIQVKNFKCFGDDPQGFEIIKPINLLIGRNNSGKSSLLDVIEYASMDKIDVPTGLWHAEHPPEFIGKLSLTDDDVKSFPRGTRGGGIPGDHYEFGQTLIGSRLTWRLNAKRGERYVELGPTPDGKTPLNNITDVGMTHQVKNQLAEAARSPLLGHEFRRISAERNVVPEGDNAGNLTVQSDGQGVTNLIQNFINKADLPSELVERTMLNELNAIFGPDGNFDDIVSQKVDSGAWEIYLEEHTKGRVPLSQSGSGLKTIMLVLAYVHLVPVVAGKVLANFILAFEELENNMHPSLLRRLLSYLRAVGEQHECTLFLTTHSSVAIDVFSKDERAQILHVTHDGKQASVRPVQTYIDNKGILDDLDVRASDLLQSNGIIWVEGPSDRIYVNRWISLWSDEELSEGTHYQCVFYGGRLLAHLSSREPDEVNQAVAILRVNRNAVVVMDSDMKSLEDTLNNTKRRVIEEVREFGGFAWVTQGTTVENYVSSKSVARWLKRRQDKVPQVGQYEDFFVYLDGLKSGEGTRFAARKPLLAETLIPHVKREDLPESLDLSTRLDELCETIRHWNNIE